MPPQDPSFDALLVAIFGDVGQVERALLDPPSHVLERAKSIGKDIAKVRMAGVWVMCLQNGWCVAGARLRAWAAWWAVAGQALQLSDGSMPCPVACLACAPRRPPTSALRHRPRSCTCVGSSSSSSRLMRMPRCMWMHRHQLP